MSQSRIAELALAAGDYVRRAVAVELDGSTESLAYVDHYLAQAGDVDDRVLALVAAAIGAYFGEVAIGRLGGEWIAESEDPAEWTVRIGAAPIAFRPVSMAAEAIRRDAVPGYDARLVVPSAFDEPLADALAAVPPVEESYYYSLTGRLETIEHAAEVLTELRRREAERKEPAQ